MTRIDDIDLVDVPDQWDEIVQRAAAAPVVDLVPGRRGGRRAVRAVAVAASVLVVAGAAALVVNRDDSTTQVATTDPSVDPTTAPAPVDGDAAGQPLIACPGGELLAGSIPGHANGPDAFGFDTVEPTAVQRWTWEDSGLHATLDVPSLPWPDSTWSGAEPIAGTRAWIAGEGNAQVLGETGLQPPCDTYHINVAGGTPTENRVAAINLATALEWVRVDVSGPEDVVDEPTVRQWALAKAAEQLGDGVHLVEVSVSEYRSDDRIGKMVGGLEGREPERAWSVILRSATGALFLPGDPEQIGRDLLTMNFGAESKGWTMAAGVSGPADQAMRDQENAVPALVVGRRSE